ELVYPQFYASWELSDEEIAEMLRLVEVPESGSGRVLAEAIARTVREHADAEAPCRFLAYEGELMGRRARVWVVEREAGKRLAGPAALECDCGAPGECAGVSAWGGKRCGEGGLR
ncbi:MAG: hypothetical protein GXN98_02420, partial [Euryarchaeota archaeon]|nr:hypothetical protein [Euryarchaeota archaeon]